MLKRPKSVTAPQWHTYLKYSSFQVIRYKLLIPLKSSIAYNSVSLITQIDKNTEWKRKQASESIRHDMECGQKLIGEMRFYIKLPKEEEHSNHLMGEVSKTYCLIPSVLSHLRLCCLQLYLWNRRLELESLLMKGSSKK